MKFLSMSLVPTKKKRVVSGLLQPVRICYSLFQFSPLFTSEEITHGFDFQIDF